MLPKARRLRGPVRRYGGDSRAWVAAISAS